MKKKVLWMLPSFLLVAALVLSSCGEAAPGEQEEEEEEEVGEPQYGGTLTVYRVSNDPNHADLQGVGAGNTAALSAPFVDFLLMGDFEKYGPRGTGEFAFTQYGLITIPGEFRTGALAESWEVTSDNIVFHIRQGVYFPAKEGVMETRELVAEDVVASLIRYGTDRSGAITWAAKGGFIDSIYAEDKYTVVVETNTYFYEWPRWLSGYGLAIPAPESRETDADATDWDKQVGTGPFMFKEYVAGSHMSYDRNPNFWGTATINGEVYDDIPFIDELIYPILKDESARIASLRTGKLDVYHVMSVKNEASLAQTNPELQKYTFVDIWTPLIALRTDIEPFNNKEVRRAMMIALDLEAINNVVLLNGELHTWPVVEGTPGNLPYDELKPSSRELYDYDPEKANQMLVDEGYPEGDKFIVTAIVSSATPSDLEMLVMAKSYWEAIGVTLEINVLEPTTFTTVDHAREGWEVAASRSGNGQLIGPGVLHNTGYMTPPNMVNKAAYSNPELDAMYVKLLRIVDDEERSIAWKEYFEVILDEAAYIPIGAKNSLTYWWPWVNNFYGEHYSTQGSGSFLEAVTWLDLDLKGEMGH